MPAKNNKTYMIIYNCEAKSVNTQYELLTLGINKNANDNSVKKPACAIIMRTGILFLFIFWKKGGISPSTAVFKKPLAGPTIHVLTMLITPMAIKIAMAFVNCGT